MPTINKEPKKEKSTFHNDTEMRKLRQKAYNDSRWKRVREAHLIKHPICQDCEQEGKVNGSDIQVHHIKSAFGNGRILYDLLLDDNNLRTLCSYHHAIQHHKEKGYVNPSDVLKQIDMLFDETITDQEIENYEN